MKHIGNFLWFILFGWWGGLSWYAVGLLWCITIIGIPVGLQCFKFGSLCFFPFGKRILIVPGVGSILLDILWWIFGGLEMAVAFALYAVVMCITIVGIPFGIQIFKIAQLALFPFGAQIRKE